VQIRSQASWMTDVKFSHRKHAAWNGCEVCHPEIFPRTKAGATPFTMLDISGGQACGACHGKVAFPLAYCDRCHVKPVR
jgi:c(7)-type cytochrome triheme protein